jgi:preprotein translocase subunit SecA
MATITIQNYFRMYDKLAGMTGTAETEETEFFQIYGLEVAVIPTNKPVIRDDRHDLVYKTRREKYNAILEETRRLHELGFPVLVGTTNVDVSETLSRMFKRAGLVHNVLNAKYHQREAEIVAAAGQPAAVTIATNMAGRGTDIKLGAGVTESKRSLVKDPEGKEVEVDEIGGLHIIGSERHESRRIDRQLRGRAGRQGDPGASQFFLSLEDDLMRLFGSERIAKIMDRLGAQEGEVLTHSLITRSIEKAQQRVELQNFQSRKRLLEYDDVMNQQREVIYSLRSFALEGAEELKGEALGMVERAVGKRVETSLESYDDPTEWDYGLLHQDLLMHYLLVIPDLEDPDRRPTTLESVRALAVETGQQAFATKITSLGDHANQVLSLVMLNVLDEKWKDHLYDLDQLRGAIHYRSWGQKDPLIEYKHEAYNMFVDLMADIANTFTERFLRVQLVAPPEAYGQGGPPRGPGGQARPARRFNALGVAEDVPPEPPDGATDTAMDIGPDEAPKQGSVAKTDPVITGPRGALRPPGKAAAGGGATDWSAVGRNDPCPCGSGKKFKKCHGANA